MAWAAKGRKPAAAAKPAAGAKAGGDDGSIQNTLSWEDKVMGPETNKKIDLKKIEELQAKEMARREKAEKEDKERREREAAQAAQRKDVAAPASKEVVVEEAPVPTKPAVKHDDAFVDQLMNEKSAPRKKTASQGPDDVDNLLAKVKDKPAAGAPKGKNDSVDQLLTSAEKQPTRTTVTRPSPALQTTKSDEEAAREETLRALAAAQAKLAADRARQKQQPAVPDAAVLKARMAAENEAAPGTAKKAAAPTLTTTSTPAAGGDDWNDSFGSNDHGRKAGLKHGKGPAAKSGWGDPFDSGAGKNKPAGKTNGKGQKKTKDPNWNDPFA